MRLLPEPTLNVEVAQPAPVQPSVQVALTPRPRASKPVGLAPELVDPLRDDGPGPDGTSTLEVAKNLRLSVSDLPHEAQAVGEAKPWAGWPDMRAKLGAMVREDQVFRTALLTAALAVGSPSQAQGQGRLDLNRFDANAPIKIHAPEGRLRLDGVVREAVQAPTGHLDISSTASGLRLVLHRDPTDRTAQYRNAPRPQTIALQPQLDGRTLLELSDHKSSQAFLVTGKSVDLMLPSRGGLSSPYDFREMRVTWVAANEFELSLKPREASAKEESERNLVRSIYAAFAVAAVALAAGLVPKRKRAPGPVGGGEQ